MTEKEYDSVRKQTARDILLMLKEIDKPDENGMRYRFPHMVLEKKVKEKYGLEGEEL